MSGALKTVGLSLVIWIPTLTRYPVRVGYGYRLGLINYVKTAGVKRPLRVVLGQGQHESANEAQRGPFFVLDPTTVKRAVRAIQSI